MENSNKLTVLFTTTVPSFSNPEKRYEIKQYSNGTKWCSCPAYKFQRAPVELRNCKHTKMLGVVVQASCCK